MNPKSEFMMIELPILFLSLIFQSGKLLMVAYKEVGESYDSIFHYVSAPSLICIGIAFAIAIYAVSRKNNNID